MPSKMHDASIIREYQRRRDALEGFAHFLLAHVQELLEHQGGKIQSVTARVKTLDSLEQKISRPDKIYHHLDHVTDLIGLRVITYFEDSIDEIAAVLEEAFEVDLEHSIDKRTAHDSERFGYQSLHYVCRLPPEQRHSGMNRWLEELPFEVQLRTVLQHGWAEIEHDLGYKGPSTVPLQIRRKFSRLAGLLELVDEEFVEIRTTLERYEREVREKLARDGEALPIDLLSLSSFLESEQVIELDRRISEALDAQVSDEVFYPDYLAKMLSLIGLRTVDELSRLLRQRQDDIIAFVTPYLEFTRELWGFDAEDMGAIPRGWGVLLAGHLELLGSHPLAVKRIESATHFFHELDYPDDVPSARRVARLFVEMTGRACR